MPCPYPNRRRRRPGRRPPDRYSGGFTPPGVAAMYRVAMPSLAGTEKRAFFNDLARRLVPAFGLGGAILGFFWLGPPGAILGLAIGLLAGGHVAVRGRFHRS